MNHKKIAELAHVSASTVSKALSGSSDISQELTEKIRKIAMEVGYFQEKSKRKRENSNNALHIAVLVPEIVSVHYASIVTCIKDNVEAKGGHIAVYIYDFDEEKCNDILKTLVLHGGIDGVMLFAKPAPDFQSCLPMVVFSDTPIKAFDTMGTDVHAYIHDAVAYLKGLGHTKIGFVGELNTLPKSDAFVLAMEKQGLVPCKDDIHIIDSRFETIGIEAAQKIIENPNRPTAILTAYDEVAMALVHTLTENHIRVPEDISVMGINNIPTSAYAQIPLTTVDIFSEEQYRLAVDLLFDKIIHETTSVKHIVMEHKIIERETTKRI